MSGIIYGISFFMYLFSLHKLTDQAVIHERSSKGTRSLTDLAFPAIYHATGNISIPSAGIREPFEVWYAGKYNRSRIDYYGGTVQTYQRADIGKYGTLFEVFPKYDYRSDNHYRGCWKKKGNKKKKVQPQGILPKKVYWPFEMNISQYKYYGNEFIKGKNCSKWIAKTEAYNRTDTYTFYATEEQQPKPVRFEMQGYDVLLVSYYDHYIIDYDTFGEWKYDPQVFNTPQVARRDRWCQNVPKRTGEAGYRSLNPMRDFMDEDNNYNHFETKFNKYKRAFKKTYKREEEYRKRMHIARHNMRYIHSMNRKQLGFQLDVNHFTDLSDEEYGSHRGLSFDDSEETEEFEKRIPELTVASKELQFEDINSSQYRRTDEDDTIDYSEKDKEFLEGSRHFSEHDFLEGSGQDIEDGFQKGSGGSNERSMDISKSSFEAGHKSSTDKQNVVEDESFNQIAKTANLISKFTKHNGGDFLEGSGDGENTEDSLLEESGQFENDMGKSNAKASLEGKGGESGGERDNLHQSKTTEKPNIEFSESDYDFLEGSGKYLEGDQDLKYRSYERKKAGDDKKFIDRDRTSNECNNTNRCNEFQSESLAESDNSTFSVPEQSEREEDVLNILSSHRDTYLQQKSKVRSSEQQKFEKIWKPPDKSSIKPFFMFGIDRANLNLKVADYETYENDFYLKDDLNFPDEFRHWYNKKRKKKGKFSWKKNRHGARNKLMNKIPKNLDWRDYGAVAQVQSQGICGSCWSFSTTAAVESAHFLKTGKLEKLSEQQLIDCTWYVPNSKDGNHACMGGWTWKSFAYIEKFGIATAESYGKYVGMESSCKTKNVTTGASIDSFMKVKANDANALKRAIALYGPATASINTEAKTLKFYSKGIYNDKECTGNTDHSILIVGYGEQNGKLYWIVRNSWGTTWGEKGYIKIENGKCGLLKKPWVIINRPRPKLPWMKEGKLGRNEHSKGESL